MRFILLILLTSTFSLYAQQADINVSLDDSFPTFELKNLNDETITLDDLKGKVLFLNTWFKNCKPCVEEMPELNKLHNKYKDKVVFISMTLDNKEETIDFLKTHDYNFEHLVDAKPFLKEVLGNKAFPRNIIIDKNGKIKHISYGLPFTKISGSEEMKMMDYTFFETPLLKVLSM